MALAESDLIQGLSDGLTGVKSGEHCQILFSGKYGYGKKPFGTIPANSAVLFEIWVEAVSNE
jgi:FKBP-type peptidyl-prolyl cis-trans isomerase